MVYQEPMTQQNLEIEIKDEGKAKKSKKGDESSDEGRND